MAGGRRGVGASGNHRLGRLRRSTVYLFSILTMRRFFIICALMMAVWIGYLAVGAQVARMVAARVGGALIRVGQGKFPDAAVFVQGRIREALWLTTLVLLWIAAHWILDRFARARIQRYRWVVHGLAGFIFLNAWVGAAMNTALFWGAMGMGAGIQNLMQFHFKRILLEETRIPKRAVLVGSSQTRAQIDEDILNRELGTNLWTTELHFPGSHGYDVLLIERQFRRTRPQLAVCYLTEGYFYNGTHGLTPPNFFGWRDLPDAWRRGAFRYLSLEEV